MTVTAASAGVANAQAAVLHALYGIGTDVTVTTAAPAPKPGSPQSARFGFSPGATAQHEDLLGYPPGLGVLNASSVASISRLPGVAAVADVLSLTDTKLTVPSVSQLGPGGQPPKSALTPDTFSVDGMDLAHLRLGPFASAKVSSGRSFAASDASSEVAVADSGYATAKKLRAGSMITIAHTAFKIIGLVRQPRNDGSADVYIPISRAQALAKSPVVSNSSGKADTIYVAATSAPDVPAVQAEIARLLPSATVTSSASLASEVSGSLASAASLATDLGRWLAIAVLIAAFAVATLLTMVGVTRRVREFGTLKALGWRTRRVVAQIMAESAATGIIGAALGIAFGYGGAALVDAIAPQLSASIAQNPGSAPAQNVSISGAGLHSMTAPGATHTVAVHMSAQVTVAAIAAAVGLAMAGALIAGSFRRLEGGPATARLTRCPRCEAS